MICPKCNYQNPDNSNFCMSCRADLRPQPIETPPLSASPPPTGDTSTTTKLCPFCSKPITFGAGFCAHCGKSLKPNMNFQESILQNKRVTDRFVKDTLKDIKLIGFSSFFPFAEWFRDKPWNLLWVRWFIVLTLFPLFLSFWSQSTPVEFKQVAYIFGVYFAVLWAIVFYNFIRPARFSVGDILKIGFFTAIFGISLDLIIQQGPIISSLYSATEANSFSGRLIGFVFGVGILEEAIKALPLVWLYIHKGQNDDLTTITFLGCISGFGFGISEAGDYSLRYAGHLYAGNVSLQNYLIDQFTRLITLPFLHAVWAGTTGYFIALGTKNRKLMKGLLAGGLLMAATLHGFYDVNSDNVFGLGIAMFSIVIFIAYIRSAEILQKKIQQLAG